MVKRIKRLHCIVKIALLILIIGLSSSLMVQAEELGSDAMTPVIGDEDKLIIGEDGTYRYRIQDDYEIENSWVQVGDNLYYFDNTGRALSDSLREMNGRIYYFNENGICQNGLVTFEGDLYFFTPALGMNVGWVSAEGDQDIYYFDEDGKAHKGFLTVTTEDNVQEPDVFYFDDDGRMHRGWLEINGGLMYFNEDGIRALRWTEINGEWYYFKEYDEGYVDTNTWLEKDGRRVYVQDHGMMVRNSAITINGMEYHMDDDGTSHVNWLSGIWNNRVYIIAFLLSSILVYISSLGHSAKIKRIAGIGAVIILSAVAACRSTSVGTDVGWYIMQPFQWAAEGGSGIAPFWGRFSRMEPLFNVLMYISVFWVRSPQFAMGVIALLINGFIYAGIKNTNGIETRWFAWAAYCLLFFNNTLNIMRQYVVVAVLFYLFSLRGRITWRKVLVYTVFATSIHYVGVIILPVFLISSFLDSRRIPSAAKWALTLIVSFIPVFSPLIVGNMIGVLVDHYSEIFGKYKVFIYGHEANNGFTANLPGIIILVVCGLLFVIDYMNRRHNMTNVRRQKRKTDTDNMLDNMYSYLSLLLMDLNYCICSNKLNNRFQYCFSIFRIEFLVLPLRRMNAGIRKALQVLITFILFGYWLYTYVYLNEGGTSPYLSFF